MIKWLQLYSLQLSSSGVSFLKEKCRNSLHNPLPKIPSARNIIHIYQTLTSVAHKMLGIRHPEEWNMKHVYTLRLFVLSLIMLISASVASADTVYWTDWTNTGTSMVGGTLTIGSQVVIVTYSGAYGFAQTSGGENFWNPSAPYVGSQVSNAPPASDIIALGLGGAVAGGTATITFSQPVEDPLLALVSWNGNTVDFGVPIQILSYGAGYWGSGIPVLNAGGTGFYGNGEVHGVIELPGTYSSITFTHDSEWWHGFTVGAFDLGQPQTSVPEPATIALLGIGLIGLASLKRGLKK
jgi:hypothetical protein